MLVSGPDPRGGRVNGVRTAWGALTPGERRRLVAPGGGTCLLAARGGGGPFTAWSCVFTRTSTRIRARFEPRFPQVNPHRLRHSFSMNTQRRGIAFDATFGCSCDRCGCWTLGFGSEAVAAGLVPRNAL